VFRSQTTLLSLAALALSFACSSDDGGSGDTTRSYAGGTPDAPFNAAPINGASAQTGTPATPAKEDPGTPPSAPATEPGSNPETVTPVGIAPGMGDTGTSNPAPSGNTGNPPTQPEPPATTPDPPVQQPPAPTAPPFVEDLGADCAVGALPNAIAATAQVPNPFQKLDGTIVASVQDWRCRRKEIRSMAERYVYGTKPGKPESVTGSVTNNRITVNVTNQGRTASFNATITLPITGSAPYPAVFGLGTTGVDTATLASQGVAFINYNNDSVGAQTADNQGGNQQHRANKTGAFYTIYGNQSTTGVMAAWAWGVSRFIDVIEASGGAILNKNALGVMGCSRNGKGALAIGALDDRIALTIPFESGTAGVPLYRAVAQAEVGDNNQPSQSLSSAFNEQAWFGDAFSAFLNSANTVPIDTHEILAMIAPRGLLILDNPFIGELTPRGAHGAALAAAEVFKALGATASFSYHSNTADGTHCLIRTEYQEPLRQAIQKHLFKNPSAAAGQIQVTQTFATANRQNLINWQTPTLQ
jgi:hypothetical protein